MRSEEFDAAVRGAAIAFKPLLSIWEASVFLGVSEAEIRHCITAGKLSPVGRVSSGDARGKILLDREDLLRLPRPEGRAPKVRSDANLGTVVDKILADAGDSRRRKVAP